MAADPTLRRVAHVGRYALGVDWKDGHDSIFPYRHLRANCPCDACEALRRSGERPGSDAVQIEAFEALGDASLFLRFDDGHETLFLLEELRVLCRCAYCIGEPERPITG